MDNHFNKKKRYSNTITFHRDYDNLPKKIKLDDSSPPIKPNGAPLTLLQQRRCLPVYTVRSRLLEEIKKASILIVIGETGSGKTTQIPQFIHEERLEKDGVIAITQPRRVGAVSLSKRVSEEMNCQIGDIVGYTIRFEDVTSQKTKLKYLTDGMLLREAMLDSTLMKYSYIILDEAHERSINTDVLFGIVKKAQELRKKGNSPLKIIVMSATMDVDHFSKYFNESPVVYLEGRQYPVKILQAKKSQPDYLHSCISTIFQIHMEEPPGDILVFLTGQEEIESMAHSVRMALKELKDYPILRVFTVYAAVPIQQMMNIFRPSNERKVIFSTNVSETSITIPGVKYVVDSGRVKARTFQPSTGLDMLKVQMISQAQAWQRAGRAGRESAGICYRVYTQQEFDNLEKNTTPEILRCNLASVMLQLLQIGVDAYSFDFMDKPSKEALDAAVRQLKLLGAVDSTETRQLTPLGKKMAQFPIDPRHSKILLSSKDFGCTEEILSIVSLMSGESVLIIPAAKREEALEKHLKFASSEGDHITMLNIYRAFNSNKGALKRFSYDNYLNSRHLEFASDVRKQLAELCEKNDIPIKSCGQNTEVVRKCFITGYFMNIVELQRDKKYTALESKQSARIHPSSVLHKTFPSYALFSEMVHTSQCYIRQLSIIDPEWLNEIAPEYFRQHRIGVMES